MILAGLDVGNNNIKCVTDQGRTHFLHALHKLNPSQIESLTYRSHETDTGEGVYEVNGTLYAIGEDAIRYGAKTARYGESRYTDDYYGVLGAIALYRALAKDEKRQRITILCTYTPKDDIHIERIKASIKGEWHVKHKNQAQRFSVLDVLTTDEPVSHFRHTIFYAGGQSLREDVRELRVGDCLIVDIGGYTTGFAVAVGGKIDYQAGWSLPAGIQIALDELAKTVRSKYRKELLKSQYLKADKLRSAIQVGYYDAGGKGMLDCRDLIAEALNPVVYQIENEYVSRYGGSTEYHSILIAGGGGWLIREYLEPRLDHNLIFTSGKNSDDMMLGAADGGYKTLQALQARGKL